MPAENVPLRQRSAKVIHSLKSGHFHISVSDLTQGVRITSGAAQQIVPSGEKSCSLVSPPKGQRPRIEHFYDFYDADQSLDLVAAPVIYAPEAVKWMRQGHQASLILDPLHGLLYVQSAGDLLSKEEPHDLAQRGQNLLGYYDLKRGSPLEFLCTGDGSMVRHGYAVDPQSPATLDDGVERHVAVERVPGVYMQISPDQVIARRSAL